MTSPVRNILFICAQNKIRSYTAEKMYENSDEYDIRSRGVADDAMVPLCEEDIDWADLIFVMEKPHRNRIYKRFKEKAMKKRIICLYIEDIYEPMEDSLIFELCSKLAPYLGLPPNPEK